MRVIQRLGLLAVVFIGLTMAGSAPAIARSNQLSGVAVYDSTMCAGPPADRRLRGLPGAPDERQLGRLLVYEG